MEQKIWKIKKLKVENIKWKEEKLQNEEGTLFCLFVFCFVFCFFVFVFFCFSLFKTTEICLGSTKMGIFGWEKSFHAGEKKSGKKTLPHQKNIPLTPLVTHEGDLLWRGTVSRLSKQFPSVCFFFSKKVLLILRQSTTHANFWLGV